MASRSEPASVAASADGVGSGGGLGLDENLSARQDRHEGKSRRTHFLIGLGLLLLALLLGRAAYDNWQLRSGTESLREAVADQSLRLAQVGDISAILGEDFVTPGTVLTGPDGQTYICAPQAGAVGDPGVTGGSGEAGAAGAEGSAGSAGTAGDAGLSGSQGAAGSQGATGATGVDGAVGATGPVGPPGPAGSVATIDMDDT
ncbi:MAG: hypothetical protein Q8P33_01675, partial [bacterium]|nr:hypothetical protein [bacterium]